MVIPENELAPYYGNPRPAKVVIDNNTYDSKIGTTKWIKVTSNGRRYLEFADTFAIITPTQPILTTSNISLTLILPIPINPIQLWYTLFLVSEKEIDAQELEFGSFRWNAGNNMETYQGQTLLDLLPEQKIDISVDPGFYVLEVHAGWGHTNAELEANYGFLFEVQE
jgi:hypothetical protein